MSFHLETSKKELPGQLSKYLILRDREWSAPLKKEFNVVFNFPKKSEYLFLMRKGIIQKPSISQYINLSKEEMRYSLTEIRNVKNRQNDLNDKLLKLKGELKKKFKDVEDLDLVLGLVLDEINSDQELHGKFINLNKKQSMDALVRLLSLRVLQETFKDLSETEKLNFKREALRETVIE